ncbi:general secretion pathway protein GspB [Aquabacterium sp.]|uniref:general secretion pathway protein GspB n=1 Tax=Aquabacterium sp. TaxID=1872578 RepID=UPI0019A869DA|nr:general secretion pathway protein GspB [Aquabacterium sp.]MBC7699545.1 general secretion pathway protein GspB [Aquabacterium sp.]
MSYILDALRRADSERERGAVVPSIHAPPVPPVADDPKPQRGSQLLLLVGVIVVLLLALAGLLAWHLMSGKEPAQATDQPPPMQATMPLPAPAPVLAPPVQRPSPSPQTQPPLGAAPILSVPTRPVPTRPVPAARVVMPTAPIPAPTADADTRIYTPSELPPNLQRDLPKLVIGGAMYSETPANRMLIINSQVFHEGDKLTPDLVLQEIRLKSAVLKYKGYRYGVSY